MSDTLWYFAYGSNMATATLRGRRGITHTRAVPGRLPGWRLVLDKPPLLPLGGSMANVVPDPAAVVLGVAYEITAADAAHIDLTEGVLIGNYRRATVTIRPLHADTEVLAAFTLTSEHRDPTLQPSRRYMGLLIAGAEEHRLPSEYVAFLRALPARDEPPEAQQAHRLLDDAFRRPRRS